MTANKLPSAFSILPVDIGFYRIAVGGVDAKQQRLAADAPQAARR